MKDQTTNYQLPTTNSPRVAIVHDWLVGGGAERVVLELHRMYPDAPIYTSYATKEWRNKLDNKVITGYLQHWPFSKLRKFLPVLRARWFKSLKLDGYDLIISSKGNGEANYICRPEGTTHICYCHSPTQFYWRKYHGYIQEPGFGIFNPLVRIGLKILVKPLRAMDYAAAQKVDYFIANSTNIQSEIKKSYQRDSVVVHPPVDVDRFQLPSSSYHLPKTRKGFITVGRQVPYKRTDIIVRVCTELDIPLVVIGSGSEHDKLLKLAGSSVTFRTNANDKEVARAMASAEAFIFAADDDFGITPVEAMAAGTPVIAYRAGGALDYVIEDKTGLFFNEQSVESLKTAIKNFKPSDFDSKTIAKHAQKFKASSFRESLKSFIDKHV